MRLGVGRHKAHRQAAFAGPAGAADAVGVFDGAARQVVIDDDGQRGNIEPAGGDVGGDQHLHFAAFQRVEHLGAATLTQLAVQRGGLDVVCPELVGDMLGRVFGGDEHQRARPAFGGQQMAQERRAGSAIDVDGALGDERLNRRFRRDLDALGCTQDGLGQGLNFGLERGREEQVLALRGQHAEKARQLVGKAQVEQPVSLVEHQDFERIEAQRVVVDQVEQAARCRNHHVAAAAQGHQLRVDRDATERDGDLEALGESLGQALHRFADLNRQLARGRQDQRSQAFAAVVAGQQTLQQRQAEGSRFARAGLRQTQHVRTAQDGGNGGGLDRCGRVIAGFPHGVQQSGRQAQRGE